MLKPVSTPFDERITILQLLPQRRKLRTKIERLSWVPAGRMVMIRAGLWELGCDGTFGMILASMKPATRNFRRPRLFQ